MAKSLQDQLLQKGLADKKKANQIRQEKRKAKKQQKGKGPSPEQAEAEQRRIEAQKAREERAERDRALARQRQEDAQQREIQAQVRQLIETHRLALENGETPYQFVDGKKIKKIHVPAEMVDKLARGQLAVARLDSGYAVVPAPAAEKIQQRDADAIVAWQEKSSGDDDDPYANFPVPDDLM